MRRLLISEYIRNDQFLLLIEMINQHLKKINIKFRRKNVIDISPLRHPFNGITAALMFY